jgi:hypothetical protein
MTLLKLFPREMEESYIIISYLEIIRKIEKLSEKESENVLEQDLGRKRQHRTLLE